MKTIWLMLMLMSSPNMPSVKYHALLYNTEGECMKSVVDYLNFYVLSSTIPSVSIRTSGDTSLWERTIMFGMNLSTSFFTWGRINGEQRSKG